MSHLESRAQAELSVPVSGPVWIGQRQYVRAPSPIHFRSEEPLEEAVSETKRHLEARTTLYLLLKDALEGDALGSDQFVYYDPTNPQRCLSPDIFVKRGSGEANFDVWKTWQSGAPDLAVEIVSASDRRDDDWEDKMARYHASGIAEVVRFDPAARDEPIRVWDRIEGDLVERAAESPHLRECLTLGLWWVAVPSEFGPQLRLSRDREGEELLPTPGEERLVLARQLAEERKARAAAEHERLVAEHTAKQAEHTAKQAEHTAKQAELARDEEARARSLAEQKLQEEALARKREAESRAQAERERDAALADLAKLRAAAAKKPVRKRRSPR